MSLHFLFNVCTYQGPCWHSSRLASVSIQISRRSPRSNRALCLWTVGEDGECSAAQRTPSLPARAGLNAPSCFFHFTYRITNTEYIIIINSPWRCLVQTPDNPVKKRVSTQDRLTPHRKYSTIQCDPFSMSRQGIDINHKKRIYLLFYWIVFPRKPCMLI